MTTPRLPTYVRARQERRELGMQTSFPAKVLRWDSSANTVTLKPQFLETSVGLRGDRVSEPEPDAITNVPVLYPRSGAWAITFPIELGTFGLVTCTKYSLDRWRESGGVGDPGDLRRFTMSGAVFHPVNLYPDNAALSNVDPAFMEIGKPGLTTQFVALANKVDAAINALVNATPGVTDSGSAIQTAVRAAWTQQGNTSASRTVKVSE